MTLAILGASGHGKVIADAAEAAGFRDIVFFDDAWPDISMNGSWAVVGTTRDLLLNLSSYSNVVVAIGNNAIRHNKLNILSDAGADLVSVVHPSAIVSPHSSLGIGSVVFAGAVVNAGAEVGAGTIVNTNAVIEHDCVLGVSCHISPSGVLAGGVRLGDRVWVGANASVRELISVGDNSVVGMGAVVTRDVAANITVVGNPARPINIT
jgi:sugar O-acyltransferase (sialic acid O-acetyltransferase NeuD family)